MSDGGKGSTQRPIKDQAYFDKEYERIFKIDEIKEQTRRIHKLKHEEMEEKAMTYGSLKDALDRQDKQRERNRERKSNT